MRTSSIIGRPASRLSRRRLLASSLAATTLATAMSPRLGRAARQTPALGDGGEFDAFVAELDAMIKEWMTSVDVPGVAVGVIAGGKEYVAGFGVTNVDHPLPVDADTLFQLGSIAKTYTGTIMMRLVDQGLVDLDAPVRAYLPEFRVADDAVSAAVTVRQLLNHSAGWLGDVFNDTGIGEDAIARFVAELAENPQIAPLGQFFSYNNAAVIVAGRLIEVVTGQTYLAALTEQVLAPLGLERTFLYPEQIMTEAFAVGHTEAPGAAEGEVVVAKPWALPGAAAPVGSHIASIRELMRYTRFHLGDGMSQDGAAVLSPAAMAAFRTPTVPGGAVGDIVVNGVGVSWFLRDLDGIQAQQHGGSTTGQEASLLLVPERNFAIGILTNAEAGAALNSAVTAWALETCLGRTVPTPTAIDSTELDLSQYVGHYRDGSGGPTIIVNERDGALAGALRDPTRGEQPADGPLVFVGRDLIRFPIMGSPLLVDFARTDTGEVGWLRFGGRLQPRVGD